MKTGKEIYNEIQRLKTIPFQTEFDLLDIKELERKKYSEIK